MEEITVGGLHEWSSTAIAESSAEFNSGDCREFNSDDCREFNSDSTEVNMVRSGDSSLRVSQRDDSCHLWSSGVFDSDCFSLDCDSEDRDSSWKATEMKAADGFGENALSPEDNAAKRGATWAVCVGLLPGFVKVDAKTCDFIRTTFTIVVLKVGV